MQTKTTAHPADAPYRVPRDTRRWPSLALAGGMHAGLLLFLWIGVNWQSTEPVAVEAEVWDLQTQAAAPLAPPPSAAPEPRPEPAPPKPPAAEPVEAPPAPQAPDIALEKRKEKLKAEKEKLAEQARLKEQRKLEEQEKADKAAKQAKDKAKAKALAEQEAAEKKELADKQQADKQQADKQAKAKRAAAEQKAADDARRLEMKRITGAVGSGGSGTAAKSTAPRMDSGYAAAITAKIKSNIAYSGSTDVAGNPRAVFKIEQLPTGEIISVRKIQSSGIPAYDSAVENAITKSSPLPKKKDGTVERVLDAGFNMKDLP
ncbi:cell envelope integrity protein TolA [Janthinobacterium fluminis]|uniref:Cell envelope integrity protein TolA n=1 Tax=Janthinobacterium fluminis TaxID=2987524 RepID=A0ABT5K811_9BURK|nr:cell envelope integrity protein TolA [Janthinobacterium fluminis]MDC8760558.1 cell envelope integrity protein TolA [Janthinobacterium fluminis]